MAGKPRFETFEEYFDIDPTSGCWLWHTDIATDGYGRFRIKNRRVKAHRQSWEKYRGPVPDGLFVLHKCDVRNCVNPDHLFLGTPQDNMSDMVAKGRHAGQQKTHCPLGHPYSGENLVMDGPGRRCRICKNHYQNLRRWAKDGQQTHC